MIEPRPIFFRRFVAWIIDGIFLSTVVAFFVWHLPTQIFQSPKPFELVAQAVLSNSEVKQKVALVEDFHKLVEANHLTPSEEDLLGDLVSQSLKESYKEKKTWEPWTWKFSEFEQKFKSKLESQNVSPETKKKYLAVVAGAQTLFQGWGSEQFWKNVTKLVSAFSLPTCYVVLLYFLLEAIMGASIGKIFTGVRIAHSKTLAGNFLIWFPRYLLKQVPLGTFVVGCLLVDPWWMLAAPILQVLYSLSCLSLLGSRKQPIYDKIAGTSVFRRKDLVSAPGL